MAILYRCCFEKRKMVLYYRQKYWNVDIHTITSFCFTNSHFWDMKLKSPLCCGSPSFIRFLLPPQARILPEMKISSANLWRIRESATSLHWWNFGLFKWISGGVTEERESLPAGLRGVMSTLNDCKLFPFTVRPSASIQFRSAKYPLCKARTFEETCSVIYCPFFNSPFLYIFPANISVLARHVLVRHLPNFYWCCRW